MSISECHIPVRTLLISISISISIPQYHVPTFPKRAHVDMDHIGKSNLSRWVAVGCGCHVTFHAMSTNIC